MPQEGTLLRKPQNVKRSAFFRAQPPTLCYLRAPTHREQLFVGEITPTGGERPYTSNCALRLEDEGGRAPAVELGRWELVNEPSDAVHHYVASGTTSGAHPLERCTAILNHPPRRAAFFAPACVQRHSNRRRTGGSDVAARHHCPNCCSLASAHLSGSGAKRRRSPFVMKTSQPFARSPVITALRTRILRRSYVSRSCFRRSTPLLRSRRSGITSHTSQSRPSSSWNSR